MDLFVHVGVVEEDDLCAHSLVGSLVGVLAVEVSLEAKAGRNKTFFLNVFNPRSKPVPVGHKRLS